MSWHPKAVGARKLLYSCRPTPKPFKRRKTNKHHPKPTFQPWESTLRHCNLHHRSIRVQSWGFYFFLGSSQGYRSRMGSESGIRRLALCRRPPRLRPRAARLPAFPWCQRSLGYCSTFENYQYYGPIVLQ